MEVRRRIPSNLLALRLQTGNRLLNVQTGNSLYVQPGCTATPRTHLKGTSARTSSPHKVRVLMGAAVHEGDPCPGRRTRDPNAAGFYIYILVRFGGESTNLKH